SDIIPFPIGLEKPTSDYMCTNKLLDIDRFIKKCIWQAIIILRYIDWSDSMILQPVTTTTTNSTDLVGEMGPTFNIAEHKNKAQFNNISQILESVSLTSNPCNL
ncbi:hypothetical protein ACJX0J_030966, partial [Zea mays]